MSYKNKDQQREYQREWARKNKKPSQSLSKGIIYWKDVQEDIAKIRDIKDYASCVKEAIKYIHTRKVNRVAVAELAIQACTIKWGGDRKTAKFHEGSRKTTLREFAVSIGVSYKTLYRWVEVVQKILMHLKESDGTLDWTAADNAVKRATISSGLSAMSVYKKQKSNPKYRNGMLNARYFGFVVNYIAKYGKEGFSKEDWDLVNELYLKLKEVME